MQSEKIDRGRAFDWGKTAPNYARYRDIYPPEFYRWLVEHGIGAAGQRVLDIGTGTGVLPRNLYPYGAKFTGVDLVPGQIEQARRLAAEGKMEIDFLCAPAEELALPDASFDVVTACQCMVYFDHPRLAPNLARMLKPGGRFAALYMAWLPGEDPVAGASEELVLKYNPQWTGRGEVRRPIELPEVYLDYFQLEVREERDLSVPFTRETWNGRMKTCRGIGACLTEREIEAFQREHLALLERIAPERFEVRHYMAAAILKKRG